MRDLPSVPGSVLYMMFRRISVVITTMSLSTFRVASPVCSPTRSLPKRIRISYSFWLLSAFNGVV